MRCFSSKGTMGSIKVIELLLRLKFSVRIHIIRIGQQLVKLLLIRPVGSLNLPVKVWTPGLDIDVIDPQIQQVPVEASLEFVPVVCPNHPDSEGHLLDDMVDELDGVVLIMPMVDLYHTNTSRIIDSLVLEPLDGPVLSFSEHKEHHIHLDMVPGNLFLIALDMGARRPSPGVSR